MATRTPIPPLAGSIHARRGPRLGGLRFFLPVLPVLLLGISAPAPSAQSKPTTAMTRELLEQIVRSMGKRVEGSPGALEFSFNGVRLVCISDTNHDRMRIIAPIIGVSTLSSLHVASILEANFHSSLDARYATSKGTLYALFVHPLSSLRVEELESAIRQVSELSRSFGTTYTSGELSYGQ